MIFRRAIVIDNDDSAFDGNKLSRVKVRILPENKGINNDDLLRWVEPYTNSNGVSAETTEHNIPEIDSQVMVAIMDEYWQTIRYLKGFYINGYSAYQKWEDDISSSITDIDTQTYPQPNIFQHYADGSAFFRNTETGEMGHFNSNGSYMVFDKDGKIIIYSKSQAVQIYNDNADISVSDSGEIAIDSSGSNSDISINAGSGTVNVEAQTINLGGASAIDGLLKGTTYEPLWDVLFALLQTHVHDSPQAPSGTLVTAPPTGGSGWQNPVTNNISTDVNTK
jgi:hypothetical protein